MSRKDRPAGRFSAHWLYQLPLVALAGLGAYAALRMGIPTDRRAYAFYAAWLAASLATVFLPSTVYAYYYAALVPATILLAQPFLDRRGPLRLGPMLALGPRRRAAHPRGPSPVGASGLRTLLLKRFAWPRPLPARRRPPCPARLTRPGLMRSLSSRWPLE